MDEKKKLKVLDRVDSKLDEKIKEEIKPKIEHQNLTNPIYKKLLNFKNEKIGDKWSVKDLLR